MSGVIEWLRAFNSKERFFLLCQVLGQKSGFVVSDDFLEELRKALPDLAIPSGAPGMFAAMDYHLDWLYAALEMAKTGKDIENVGDGEDAAHLNGEQLITGTQKDIDFLIAYDDGDGLTRMIFIEAKGVTGWSNKQMSLKAECLKRIFEEVKLETVKPYFVLMSPGKSRGLKTGGWPAWMKESGNGQARIPLVINGPLRKVTRCSGDKKVSSKGDHWKVEKRKVPG